MEEQIDPVLKDVFNAAYHLASEGDEKRLSALKEKAPKDSDLAKVLAKAERQAVLDEIEKQMQRSKEKDKGIDL